MKFVSFEIESYALAAVRGIIVIYGMEVLTKVGGNRYKIKELYKQDVYKFVTLRKKQM